MSSVTTLDFSFSINHLNIRKLASRGQYKVPNKSNYVQNETIITMINAVGFLCLSAKGTHHIRVSDFGFDFIWLWVFFFYFLGLPLLLFMQLF